MLTLKVRCKQKQSSWFEFDANRGPAATAGMGVPAAANLPPSPLPNFLICNPANAEVQIRYITTSYEVPHYFVRAGSVSSEGALPYLFFTPLLH